MCPADIKPIVLVPSEGKLTKRLERRDVDYLKVPYTLWISPPKFFPVLGPAHLAKNLIGYLLMRSSLEEYDIDVVYTNTIAAPMGGLVAEYLSVPNIWHIREFVEEDHNRWFDLGKRITTEFIERSSSTVVYNSNAVERKYTSFFDDPRERVVYNGPISADKLDERNIRTSGIAGPVDIVIVGSIRQGKNQIEAIEMLGEAAERDIDIELTIVGDGDSGYIKSCQARADKLGVSDQVHWEGYQDEVADYYRETDVTLVPSKSEAFGRVVVEAMSYGSPVLARDAGALPELITHGETGLLYTTITELLDHIDELRTDDTLPQRLSANGLEHVRDNFTKEAYASKIYSIIRSEILTQST